MVETATNGRWWVAKVGVTLLGPIALVGWARLFAQDRGGERNQVLAIRVQDPVKGQLNLTSKKEHCAVSSSVLATIGSAVGQQVRVGRSETEFAIFTIVETQPDAANSMAISQSGRNRLGPAEWFDGRVSAQLPRSELTDAEASRRGELVERLDDDGQNDGLLILAPHGGQIEPPTDLQAERVGQQIGSPRITTWRCRGYQSSGGPSAFDRWHITSTDISTTSFPLLGRIAARRFDYAVSFHGMAEDRVLIGGAGPSQLKVEIRDAIREALAATTIRVDIAQPDDANGGRDPQNIVNRFVTTGGVQIEQSLRARRDHWKEIADAVAQVYANKL